MTSDGFLIGFMHVSGRESSCIPVRKSFGLVTSFSLNRSLFWSRFRSKQQAREKISIKISPTHAHGAEKNKVTFRLAVSSLSTVESFATFSQIGDQDLIINFIWQCVETCSRFNLEKKFAFDICETRRNVKKFGITRKFEKSARV